MEGGVEAGGQMVDERFLARIDKGEACFVTLGTELNRVEHYVYIGDVGGETKTMLHLGKYMEGGVEAGGQMVDERFLARIDNGEACFVTLGTELNRVERYVYIGDVGDETQTMLHMGKYMEGGVEV